MAKLEHQHDMASVRARIDAPDSAAWLRDSVYGAIDGAVTTFAIVASVAGAGLDKRIILALGIANVLADGFSMSAANYSGTKAERDNAERLRLIEERHIRIDPEGERRELRVILENKGLSGQVLDDAVEAIAAKRDKWIDLMLVDEYGMSPVAPHPMRAALITFCAFLIAGAVPLIPFVLAADAAFEVAIVATGLVFFAIGTLKSIWSVAPWWRSGLETLAIGGIAATIAFAVGRLFHV